MKDLISEPKMKAKKWQVKEVAALTGVTVRTLHYYDEIGLLPPCEINAAGYRFYDEAGLEILQQILFFRELDFSLREIKNIMSSSAYDRAAALMQHKQLLIKKRARLDGLIELVDKTIKGDGKMSFQEFDSTEIKACKEKYAAEVQERWGQTQAFAQSEQKTATYDDKRWASVNKGADELLKAFAEQRYLEPESAAAQKLVEQWQAYITASFYDCSKEILSGLGMMYVADERFKKNIDQNGTGTAEFMAKAIKVYCEK